MFLNRDKTTACRNLWAAVLEQAVEDLNRGSTGEKAWARRWVNSDEEHLPSFLAVCEVLDFCPDEIREKLEHPISFKNFLTWRYCCRCDRKMETGRLRFDYSLEAWICKKCDKKFYERR